jgi:ribose 5-phosphate isomerase RpiB
MADVGLGQLITTTGRARSRKLKDACRDNLPVYDAMEKHGGIRRIDGGRTIVEEAKSGQNSTVAWVGEAGSVSLADQKVLDAAEFNWKNQLGSVTWTLAERYKNSGGSDTKLIDLIAGKFEVLEDSMMNEFHEGMLSDGTGSGALQLQGLGALVAASPVTGTIGGIDRSSSNATWFRNDYATSTTAVSASACTAANILQFLDYFLDRSYSGGKVQVQIGLLGATHWRLANQALQSRQQIVNVSGEAKGGYDSIMYRGVPLYLSGGINYSGATAQTATYTYLLNVKPGGINLVFHEKAEFDMLEPVNSADQAAISRLMFTMAAMTCGALVKRSAVGWDA